MSRPSESSCTSSGWSSSHVAAAPRRRPLSACRCSRCTFTLEARDDLVVESILLLPHADAHVATLPDLEHQLKLSAADVAELFNLAEEGVRVVVLWRFRVLEQQHVVAAPVCHRPCCHRLRSGHRLAQGQNPLLPARCRCAVFSTIAWTSPRSLFDNANMVCTLRFWRTMTTPMSMACAILLPDRPPALRRTRPSWPVDHAE